LVFRAARSPKPVEFAGMARGWEIGKLAAALNTVSDEV
jgi:hypothetical protein